MRALSPLEARVLGVLVEKQHTVPDTYPLSLNALVAGCNQKTARDPVINATEAEVLTAVDGLKALSLVFEGSGSRVVPLRAQPGPRARPAGAVGGAARVLMLRGPQTAAELRLQQRAAAPLRRHLVGRGLSRRAGRPRSRRGSLKLPRAPGAREARWAHLLCGEVALPARAAAATPTATCGVSAGEIAALKAEQARLAAELAQLRALVQRIGAELGIDADLSRIEEPDACASSFPSRRS